MNAGPKTSVVVDSGIVPEEILEQMRKWGVIPRDCAAGSKHYTHEEITERFQRALESEAVVLRDTDLDALKTYLRTQTKGRLKLQGIRQSMEVYYSCTELGEYVLPWRDESIRDALLDPETYLNAGGKKVYFSDVRDLFFGSTKAFIVCTPIG